MKGLICAGGTATRLEELTRVTNKHLLPVGPLADGLLPAAAAAAGRRRARCCSSRASSTRASSSTCSATATSRRATAASRCSISTSPTRCRSSRAGSRRSSGWRATSPRGEKLVVCLGDNIFEHAQADAIAGVGRRRARLREGGRRIRRTSASSPTATTDASPTSSRRPASSTRATTRRRRATRSSGSTATRRTSSRSSTRSQPSRRGELEITDVNRAYAQRGELDVRRVEGWWHDGGKHWARPRRRRPADRGDRARTSESSVIQRVPARAAHRGRARLVHGADARERAAEAGPAGEPRALAAGRDPRRCTTTSAARTTSSSASQGMVRVVVLDRETGETFTEDIGDENPVAIYVPGTHAHGYEALTDCLFCYLVTEEYDAGRPRRARRSLGRSRASSTSGARDRRSSRTRDSGRGVLITGAGGQLGHALAEAFPRRARLTRARLGRAPSRRRPALEASSSSCTRPPGRTSTAPRTIRRARRR